MVRSFAQAALLPLALACLVASSPGRADGDTACQAEDSSLLQLRPDVKAVHGAAQVGAQGGRLKCPPGKLPAVLGSVDGNRFSLQYDEFRPLDVQPGSTVVLLLCNVGNSKGGSPNLQSSALVKEVGAGAKVYVLVEDSFNVKAKGDVNVGPPLLPATSEAVANETTRLQQVLDERKAFLRSLDGQCPPRFTSFLQEQSHHVESIDNSGVQGPNEDQDAKKEEQMRQNRRENSQSLHDLRQGQGSLVPPVVGGPIGPGATVQVTVSGSGNVKTERGSLTVNDASLLGEIVSTTGGMPGTTLQVRVTQSGNVHAKRGALTIAGQGSLLATVVNGSDFSRADVDVHMEGSSRVWARDLTLVEEDARLMESVLLSTGDSTAEDAEFGVTLVQVATFDGERWIRIPSVENVGELYHWPTVADVINLQDTLRSKFNVYVNSAWNFHLCGDGRRDGDILGRGYLMYSLMHVDNLESCEVQVTVLASAILDADAHSPELPSLIWLEELIFIQGLNASDVSLVVGGSGNLNVDLLEVTGGAFIRTPVNVFSTFDPVVASKLDVTIDDSANWQGQLFNTNGFDFEAIDTAVDFNPDAVHSHIRLSMTRSANLRGECKGWGKSSTICLGSELIQQSVEADDLEDSVLEVTLRDTATAHATRVEMFQQELIDEGVEVDHLTRTKVKVVLDGVGNIDADVVVLEQIELIEVVLDTDNLEDSGTSIDVSVTDSANVRAKTFNSSDGGYLMDDVLQAALNSNASIRLSVTRSANARAVSHIDDGGLLRNVVNPDNSNRNLAGISIILAEVANIAPHSSLETSSYLLKDVISDTTDISSLKSLSMFATAVAGDTVSFYTGSAPCMTPDLLAEVAVPFVHSCVPMS